MANNLATEKKAMAVSLLAEGSSIRAIERITGIHQDTIMRLGVRVGQACAKIQDQKFQNLACRRLEIDEIWGFIGKKKENAKPFEIDAGDIWKFIALDSDTKLIPVYLTGQRTMIFARAFLSKIASRITNRIQLSSDGLAAYRETVEAEFGSDVDYGQIVKTFSVVNLNQSAAGRYSPAEVIKTEKTVVCGMPDVTAIQPLTLRSRTTPCACTADG